MALPDAAPRVTVSTGVPLVGPGGTVIQGKILFVAPSLVVVPSLDLTIDGAEVMELAAGSGTLDLIPSDVAGMNPSGWTYEVRSAFENAPNWVRYVKLTSDMTTLKLSDVLVPDPVAGAFTTLLDPSTLGTAATKNVGTTSGTVAAGDDPRFGKIGGVTVSGTPTAGQVPTATSGTAATWQTPAAGGGGSIVRTAEARITVENVALPTMASWAIVTTSAGTGSVPLKGSIKAAAGDRVRVEPLFMRTGSGFYLDIALLDSGGAISIYAGSKTSSPLPEGNPLYYPQSGSFPAATGPIQFTVSSAHIDGSGNISAALVGQGSGTETVYASSTYPFVLLFTNLGPEPA